MSAVRRRAGVTSSRPRRSSRYCAAGSAGRTSTREQCESTQALLDAVDARGRGRGRGRSRPPAAGGSAARGRRRRARRSSARCCCSRRRSAARRELSLVGGLAAADGRRGRARPLRADQVAERRDAQPPQGRRRARRGARRRGRRRDRRQRQPDAGRAARRAPARSGPRTGRDSRPGADPRDACSSGSSTTTTAGSQEGSTRSTTVSAPATSCAAGGSPSRGPRERRSGSPARERSRSSWTASAAWSRPARSRTSVDRAGLTEQPRLDRLLALGRDAVGACALARADDLGELGAVEAERDAVVGGEPGREAVARRARW